MKPASEKIMHQEDMYHFQAFAMNHWLEILIVGVVLIFLLMQITRQR
jgi:hypothetical protein